MGARDHTGRTGYCPVCKGACDQDTNFIPEQFRSMEKTMAGEKTYELRETGEKSPGFQSAGSICAEATRLMEGPSARRHGDKVENTKNIARLWSGYLEHEITAVDVANMMVLLKVARTKSGGHNIDNYVDIAGWGALAGEIAERTKL